jgi:beta-N-acetylhexosaminidase
MSARAGRFAMVDLEGRSLTAPQARFLRDHAIRAVVLFRHNLGGESEIRALTADLRDALGEHALIGVDQEGGAVIRATCVPQAPAAMALGAAGDEALAEAVGAAVARGLRSLGFNWNFAPVLDVNNNPANPVIAERSFGADPGAVARLAGAWMRGALREGVACCLKHFPGHGDTHVDSHLELPVVDKPRTALDALELAPFHALAATAPAIMTAHIVYPALDAEHPATLSRTILGGVLRGEWGYDGVVITDSLVMQAIRSRYGHERASVLAIAAGADMVMALGEPSEQAAAIAAIEAAHAKGLLAAATLDRAQRRLDALAARFPVAPRPYDAATRAADEALMQHAWARGLTALRDARPPARDRALRVVTQRAVPGDGVAEPGPRGDEVASLFAGFGRVEVVQVDDLATFDGRALPRDDATVVLASNIRARYGSGARGWRPDLHLALWNPFQALDFDVPTVLTWGYAAGALAALRAWLEGRAGAPGRAPVPLD